MADEYMFTFHRMNSPKIFALSINEKDQFLEEFDNLPKPYDDEAITVVYTTRRKNPWGVRNLYSNSLAGKNFFKRISETRALHMFLNHPDSVISSKGFDKCFQEDGKSRKCTQCNVILPTVEGKFNNYNFSNAPSFESTLRSIVQSPEGEMADHERWIKPAVYNTYYDHPSHGKAKGIKEGRDDPKLYEMWRICALFLFFDRNDTVVDYAAIVQWRGSAIKIGDFTVAKGFPLELVNKAKRMFNEAVEGVNDEN